MNETGIEINFEHTVTHIVGEPAGLRDVDEHDPVDFARMWEAENSAGMVRISDGDTTPPSKNVLRRFIRNLNRSANKSGISHLYGVTAEEDPITHEPLPVEQRGEVEGWLRTDASKGELERYQRIMNCTLPKDTPCPLEVAYLKRPNGPRKLMASAVRQLCLKVLDEDSRIPGGVTEIPAKTGVNSQIIPRRPIMLFVEADNTPSQKAAEEAGFERVKSSVRWMTKDEPTDFMYVLNWDKLQKIVEEQTKSTVLRRMENLFKTKLT